MKKFGKQNRTTSLEKKNLTSSPSFDDDDDFEFAVAASSDSPIGFAADEVFSGGKILPVYPVFNRSLLQTDPINAIEDPVKLRSGSTSSTSSEESEFSPPAGDLCVWNPRSTPQSPGRCKKSSSTGSSSRWKLKDLMTGRSHSDGKEKISYVAPEKERNLKPNSNPNPPRNLNKEAERDKKKKPKEMDLITAHRLFYGKESAAKGVKGGRAYLPHRPGPVGLFANGNGLSRTTFPF